jgi:hypothetical protein
MSAKKYRTIIIDGENWAWSFYAKGDYYGTKKLKIWKNRKLVYENAWNHEYGDAKNYKTEMTPKKINRFINLFLKK